MLATQVAQHRSFESLEFGPATVIDPGKQNE